MNKNIKLIIFISILVASIALAIAGFILLPDTIITQFGSGGNNTTMPKAFGILIPLAMAIAFDVMFLIGKNEKRDLIIAAVGVVLMIFTLFVNL